MCKRKKNIHFVIVVKFKRNLTETRNDDSLFKIENYQSYNDRQHNPCNPNQLPTNHLPIHETLVQYMAIYTHCLLQRFQVFSFTELFVATACNNFFCI